MTRADETNVLLDYLQQARDAQFGIELTFATESACIYFRQRIYEVRSLHIEYRPIVFVTKGSKLWIAKRDAAEEETDVLQI